MNKITKLIPKIEPTYDYVFGYLEEQKPFSPQMINFAVSNYEISLRKDSIINFLSQLFSFKPKEKTFYSSTTSPGFIVKNKDEYMMFFSAADFTIKRTICIARTRDLDGPWTIDLAPIVPPEEQVENSSMYYEPANKTWFLFTNHIGLDKEGEYTDAIWVYWSKDLNKWSTDHKAIVLDGQNCKWSKRCIGLPSVIKYKNRLAVLYDAPGGNSVSHMRRSIGLAFLNLPLNIPE